MIRDQLSIILIALLVGADATLWYRVFTHGPREAMYALDVGQGDSTLITLESGVKVLTDAGPDGSAARSLARTLPQGERYIDLGVITHPQLDHMGGFLDVLDHYELGAMIVNGRDADDAELGSPWRALVERLDELRIPIITLRAGDRIRIGAESIDILSPGDELIQSGELNDTALVQLVHGRGWSALLTADIGFTAENELVRSKDLRADILKVGHHGSKYSTSEAFLGALEPKVATISSGARNRYGHPAPETLDRLAASGANVFRTDLHGTITVIPQNGKLIVKTEQ